MTPSTPNTNKRQKLSFSKLPLSSKFIISVLVPVLALGILFMALVGHRIYSQMHDDLDQEVTVTVKSFADTVETLLWNYQYPQLGSALEAIISNPAIYRTEVSDTQGNTVLAAGTSRPETNSESPFIQIPIFHTQPTGGRFNLGQLTVYYTYASIDEAFRVQISRGMTRLFIIAIAFITCTFFVFRRMVSTPISRLLEAIRSTRKTGIWTMVDWESEDEIGEVIAARNALVEKIAKKEKDLEDSERRYRQLFDNAQVGIFKTRPDGTVSAANQKIVDIMGFDSIEDFKARNAAERYVDQEERERLWDILKKDREVHNFRAKLSRKNDGGLIWVEFSGRLDPDNSLNGIMVEITARIEAEKILKERDELHRAFFDENKAPMLLYDPQSQAIQFANQAACQYYGYSDEELTSMTKTQLNQMDAEDIFAEMQHATMERRGFFKFVHTLKDRSTRDVEVYTGPISIGNRQLHYSIVHDVTEKRRLERQLEQMATTDQLTGALNRHAFFSDAAREITRARRYNHPLAVLMIDLDHFKEVNDTYGHAVGDEVLRQFAHSCMEILRDTDILGRMGGEEFAAILVETDQSQAAAIGERLREAVERTPITAENDISVSITVSIGVSMLRDGDTETSMLDRADKRLYEAKRTGRNKLVKA